MVKEFAGPENLRRRRGRRASGPLPGGGDHALRAIFQARGFLGAGAVGQVVVLHNRRRRSPCSCPSTSAPPSAGRRRQRPGAAAGRHRLRPQDAVREDRPVRAPVHPGADPRHLDPGAHLLLGAPFDWRAPSPRPFTTGHLSVLLQAVVHDPAHVCHRDARSRRVRRARAAVLRRGRAHPGELGKEQLAAWPRTSQPAFNVFPGHTQTSTTSGILRSGLGRSAFERLKESLPVVTAEPRSSVRRVRAPLPAWTATTDFMLYPFFELGIMKRLTEDNNWSGT